MNNSTSKYDVAIIGTGIGGSTLAAVLARQGLSVIAFEAGMHPRFTVGESMILKTSETMRALAEFYDVPELAYFSSKSFASCRNLARRKAPFRLLVSYAWRTPRLPKKPAGGNPQVAVRP